MKFDYGELKELLLDFNKLTGIRIALFDENYETVLGVPENGSAFCDGMNRNAEFAALCEKCNAAAFKRCKSTKKLTVYKCHAGLTEAAAPISEDGVIIGYLMFGQVRGMKDKTEFINRLESYCRSFEGISEAPDADKIKYRTDVQVRAAAKILDACTSYILHKCMASSDEDRLLHSFIRYVSDNLHRDLSAKTVSNSLGISRTELYEMTAKMLWCGPSRYVKTVRIERAKKLLQTTEKPISLIAVETGFSDYNYFGRVFRSETGVSPKTFRRSGEK